MRALGEGILDVYFGGDLEAGVALTGQVAGRIDAVRPVAEIIADTVAEFRSAVAQLCEAYGPEGGALVVP